jgi:Tfp pilus assembly protein PilF/TolB-like protein
MLVSYGYTWGVTVRLAGLLMRFARWRARVATWTRGRSPPVTAADAAGETPSPQEVRSCLDRIVASDGIRTSPQLVAFLGFVVEAVLRDESRLIKGYTIAVEALGRPKSFDPQADSIVRVVAGRLRRALKEYYAGAGADDAVIIELPLGGYVPSFRRRAVTVLPAAAEPASPAAGAALNGLPWRRRAMLGAAAGAAIGIFIVGGVGLVASGATRLGIARPPASNAAPQTSHAGRVGPVVYIQPFEPLGTSAATPFGPERLRGKLADAMARFDGINVVTDLTPPAGRDDPTDWSEYRFTGSAEYHEDGATTLSFRLVDAGDGTVVWSRLFARLPAPGDPGAAEDAVVRDVAAAIAEPFGVIWGRELAAHASRDPRRACMIATIEAWRRFNPAQHEHVRQCLEKIIADDPTYATADTGLALVYLRDFYLDRVLPGRPPPLDLALQTAQRAVELKPYSARANEVLFVIRFTRGDMDLAFAIADRAVALNPYDSNILGEYGARLIAVGQVERGTAMLNEAAAHSLVRPEWFDFHLFLAAYLAGDFAAATRCAAVIANNNSLFGLLAGALVAKIAGDPDKARRAIDRLVALNPGWRTGPERQLAKFFPAANVRDRLLHDLEAVGLGATN